ncbi:DUF2637 domain-containing protein [Micromonospora polyrhachis]|nr:DUF2637 domain-containing protein [Micromonospora polyrhachis]
MGDRFEGVVLVLILLTVGGLAGAASFTHVHDWTMTNSPAGTGDWFGWANAAISELIPIAALLTIRKRRRTGGPVGYPMFLLVAAVALSLSAQLAVAKPGLSGWLLSAVPALAFLGLSKLVLNVKPAPPSAEPHFVDLVPVEDDDNEEPTPAQVDQDDEQPDRSDEQINSVDQVAMVDLVRRESDRPGLVPVPATAFAPRNGTRVNPSAPAEEATP